MTTTLNHWTHEQNTRQLEAWSERHPHLAALASLLALVASVIVLSCGLLAYLAWEIPVALWRRSEVLRAVVGLIAGALLLYGLVFAALKFGVGFLVNVL